MIHPRLTEMLIDEVRDAYVSPLGEGVPFHVHDLHIDMRADGSLVVWGSITWRAGKVVPLSDTVEMPLDAERELLFQGSIIEVDEVGNFIAQSVPGHSSLLCLVRGAVTKTLLSEF